MDKSRRPTYLNANAVAAQIAAPGNFNDSPYSLDLERLDHLLPTTTATTPGDNATSNGDSKSSFMMAVLAEKEALLKEAEFVRKLMHLDEITVGKDEDEELVAKSKKKMLKVPVKAKKEAKEEEAGDVSPLQVTAKGRRKGFISSDEEEDDEGGDGKGSSSAKKKAGDEDVKEMDGVKEEEDTDEEKPLDEEEEYEEDNDYMNAHFDNGEDYAD